MVYRSNKRPVIDVFEWPLRRALPSFPIPLATGDPDIWFDLQSAFEEIYTGAGFAYTLPYGRPLVPPLRESDHEWLDQRLKNIPSRK
jgi:hypothetical protein